MHLIKKYIVSCEFFNHVFDVDFWNPHIRMMLFGSRFWCHVPLLRSFLICETDIKYHIRQNSIRIVVLTKRNAQKVHIANLACVTVGGRLHLPTRTLVVGYIIYGSLWTRFLTHQNSTLRALWWSLWMINLGDNWVVLESVALGWLKTYTLIFKPRCVGETYI